MARKYTCKSGSRRWPLQVFFNILDLACINAWILYKETTGENISRKDFMFQLADELASDYKNSKSGPSVLPTKEATTITTSKLRKSCQVGLCKKIKKVNKTANLCNSCKKYVCGKCTQRKLYFCKKCEK